MIAPARAAAFEILRRVATTDAHSDELLRASRVDALSPQDRALTTTLVLGALRWQLKLDVRIRSLLVRPEARLAPPVETALRLGAFQLLYLDRVPAHAAISESVELAKRSGETYAAGMVNAVLRKIAKQPRAPERDEPLADQFAHPRWMVDRWLRFYGSDAARAVCAFDQEPAPISVRLVHPDAESSLASEGVELEAGEFLATARRVLRGDVARSQALCHGWVRIQDEASQLVAELAGHGSNILDTCAAPGGKTAILAECNAAAHVLAVDASKRRLDVMRRNFANEHVKFLVQDASAMQLKPEYDLILCDVPCTGTGTIGRNPEIRFHVSEEEIARQQKRQVKILSCALKGLAPGGRLLYSTCSLEPEENESVIAEVCKQARGFEVLSLEDDVSRLEREGVVHVEGAAKIRQSAMRDGYLRTLPGVHACDGFFAALLARKATAQP